MPIRFAARCKCQMNPVLIAYLDPIIATVEGLGTRLIQFVLQMEAIEIVMNSYQSKLSVEFFTILSQGNYHIR